MKKVVVADNVTRTYGKFTAVDGVSFHVAQGELVALLGSNGAGKTSLLEVLQGSTRSNDGRVRVFGLDPVTIEPPFANARASCSRRRGSPRTSPCGRPWSCGPEP